jgi:hypothetical protein
MKPRGPLLADRLPQISFFDDSCASEYLMKTRITSKWRRDRTKPASLEDNAVALAYIIWQIALVAAKNLHAEDFVYDSDKQRIGVIREHLAFLVHASDRLAHDDMTDAEREHFITTLARAVARHLQRNQADIMGPGDYADVFVALLNERMREYSQTAFPDKRPGFACLRCLGEKILTIMGATQINRWVIDQVMEIDAPDAFDHLKQAMANLFGTAPTKLAAPFDPE